MPKIQFKTGLQVRKLDQTTRDLTPLQVNKGDIFEAVKGKNGKFVFSSDGQLYEVAAELVTIIIEARNWLVRLGKWWHNLFN